jgi:hypothetical protein
MQQQHSPARPWEPPPPSPWVPEGSRLDWMVIRERISGANLIRLASMPIAAAPDAVRRTLELERNRTHAGAERQEQWSLERTPGAVERTPGAVDGELRRAAAEQWRGSRVGWWAVSGSRLPAGAVQTSSRSAVRETGRTGLRRNVPPRARDIGLSGPSGYWADG